MTSTAAAAAPAAAGTSSAASSTTVGGSAAPASLSQPSVPAKEVNRLGASGDESRTSLHKSSTSHASSSGTTSHGAEGTSGLQVICRLLSVCCTYLEKKRHIFFVSWRCLNSVAMLLALKYSCCLKIDRKYPPTISTHILLLYAPSHLDLPTWNNSSSGWNISIGQGYQEGFLESH